MEVNQKVIYRVRFSESERKSIVDAGAAVGIRKITLYEVAVDADDAREMSFKLREAGNEELATQIEDATRARAPTTRRGAEDSVSIDKSDGVFSIEDESDAEALRRVLTGNTSLPRASGPIDPNTLPDDDPRKIEAAKMGMYGGGGDLSDMIVKEE